MPAAGHDRAVVLCPMQIEHRAVARALRAAGLTDACAVQTGIGKDAIVRAVRGLVEGHARQRPSLVVLAGACGALREAPDVPGIARVVDEHGHAWDTGEPGVTLIGVDRIVSTPEQKRALAQATGAAVVDMESHAFIRACEELSLPWGIVRGVSDTPDETLPAEVLAWIAPDGGTRAARAAWDLARRPRLLGHIVPVVRRSNRVLPAVGRAAAELVKRRTGLVAEAAR